MFTIGRDTHELYRSIWSLLAILRAGAFSFILATPLTLAEGRRAQGMEQRRSITQTVEDCVAGWNSGDLDRFLALFEQGPDTTVIMHGEIIKGFAAIREIYSPGFSPNRTEAMPAFDLDVVDIRSLGAQHALVLARYKIAIDAEQTVDGIATMIFRHSDQGWRVINDQGTPRKPPSK